MLKKTICLSMLVLFAVPVLAEDTGAGGPPVDKKVGYALLDAIGQTFHEMAVSGSGGVEKVTQAVSRFMIDARKAKEQKQIDAQFFARYRRILGIIKLAVGPDPDGILVPIIDRELGLFVKDVLAEDFKSSGPEAIGQVANAIADEIINLHLYLDNIETKENLRKAWDEKFSAAGEKKKDEDQ
jgi:hypothetical protein